MSPIPRTRFPWWMAVVGVVLFAAFVLAVRNVRIPEPPRVVKKNVTQITVTKLQESSANAAINEQSSLLDPTPLFLPTEITSSSLDVKLASNRDLGNELKGFPPRLTQSEGTLALNRSREISQPSAPVEVLALGVMPNPLEGLNQAPPPPVKFAARAAVLEFVNVHGIEAALKLEILNDTLGEALPGEWKPLEMMVNFEESGLVGSPFVISSSGSAQVDNIFRRYVSRLMRLGHRIPPGLYSLRIGP